MAWWDATWEEAQAPSFLPPGPLCRSRRAQGWQQIRAILLSGLWSLWLCSEHLHPHSCAHSNLGRVGIPRLCLLETPTQCPRSHVGGLPCLVGHIQESSCLSPLLPVRTALLASAHWLLPAHLGSLGIWRSTEMEVRSVPMVLSIWLGCDLQPPLRHSLQYTSRDFLRKRLPTIT